MKRRQKEFLNDSLDEFGSIAWAVRTDDRYYKVRGELVIKDCQDTVNLDFSCTEVRHIDKRLAKLDVLIDSLTNMRKALEDSKPKKLHY